MRSSEFKFISLGQVVQDATPDTFTCVIRLTELMPNATGDYNAKEEFSINNVSAHGAHYSKNISKSFTITAKWINLYNSNRVSAPNVVCGEYVHVFQFAGSDEYFWASVGTNLRKQERVVNFYSNKKESKPNQDCGSDGYFTVIDTIDKEIALHTSDNDGEKTTYDLVLNTEDAKFTIKDKQGNYIHLESTKEDGFISININNTIQLHNKHYVINADEDYTINTKNQYINNELFVLNIASELIFNVPKFGIFGNGDEVVQILLDLCDVAANEEHIGNLAIPTKMTGYSRAEWMKIKKRINAFKLSGNTDKGLTYKDPNTEGNGEKNNTK